MDITLKDIEQLITASENRILQTMKEKFNNTELRFHKLQTELENTTNELNGLKNDTTELKNDISELKTNTTELKNDITGLKNDIIGLKHNVTGLAEKVEGLKQFITDGLAQQEDNLTNTIEFFMKEIYQIRPTEKDFDVHEKRITTLEQKISHTN